MILRKPYAFFIKHFKLIHIVLSFLMLYCVYCTNKILKFFGGYISDGINLKGQELVSIYMPILYRIMPILILLVLAIILSVMIVKKKPMFLYIFNGISYIYTLVIIQISKNTLSTMEVSLLDPRSVRLMRDFIMISFIIQIIGFIIVFIRGIGFDVKKFDFKGDLKNLEIDEADREEFEVSFNFDKNKARRNYRRKIRYLKYAYKENKLLISIVFLIVSVFSVSFLGYKYYKMDRPVSENVEITNNGIKLKINNSYITNTDYKGNIIDPESVFVILQIDVKKESDVEKLEITTTKLQIGDYIYVPTYDYIDSFYDFGTVYLGKEISREYEKKVLVYKIPKQLKDEKIEFKFTNVRTSSDKTVKLNIKDLTNSSFVESSSLKEELQFKDSILSDYKFTVNEFDIQDKYKLSYNFCYKNECTKSYEYLVPSINTNTDKTILRLNATLTTSLFIPRINDAHDVIYSFGTLHYVVNGKEKVSQIPLNEIVSNKVSEKNVFYIEVPKEVKKAEQIYIKFNIRNKIYEYKLK